MNKSVFIALILLLNFVTLFAQNEESKILFERAIKSKLEYNFEEAKSLANVALEKNSDSLVKRNLETFMAQCDNGLLLIQYGTKPSVISFADVPFLSFQLYIDSLGGGSWSGLPNALTNTQDSTKNSGYLFITGNENLLIFSKPTPDNGFDLYFTRKQNNMWSAPQSMGNKINSVADEINPFLSIDGYKLYFASNGHSGVGGFDLYLSIFDSGTKEWSTPENLGFPYSSVGDDLFFATSQDLTISYLVSNRNNFTKEAIRIYKITNEINPVKKPYDNLEDLRFYMLLTQTKVSQSSSLTSNDLSPEGVSYENSALKVRTIQESYDKLGKQISKNRELYQELTNIDDKAVLAKKIEEDEFVLISLQTDLRNANAELQKAEELFLSRGMIPKRESVETVIKDIPRYKPFKQSTINFPKIEIEEPKKETNLDFMISEKSEILPFKKTPNSLVYHIQLFLVKDPVSQKTLRGLNPVFEEKTATGKYIYYTGVFSTFESANLALIKVKKAGIPGAFVAAFMNGESVHIKKAQALEVERSGKNIYELLLEPLNGGSNLNELNDLLVTFGGKDIIKRTSQDGKVLYVITPFSNKQDAEQLMSKIDALNLFKCIVQQIKL